MDEEACCSRGGCQSQQGTLGCRVSEGRGLDNPAPWSRASSLPALALAAGDEETLHRVSVSGGAGWSPIFEHVVRQYT